jgi:hypothetical protein
MYTPNDSGMYKVRVIQDGCSGESECILLNPIGIKENNIENSISIYPNPSSEEFYISSSQVLNIASIKLFNIQSELVESVTLNLNKTAFSIEGPSGIYFLELETGVHEKARFKIIKK